MARRHVYLERFLAVLLATAMVVVALLPMQALASELGGSSSSAAATDSASASTADESPTLSACSAKVQSSKDAGDADAALTGELSSGQTIWANVYCEATGEDSEKGSGSLESVSSQDGWSYQWLSSSAKSSSPDDYVAIEGATSQSLTIDSSLAGSYVICRITDGTTTLYAPGSEGGVIAEGSVPGPVASSQEQGTGSAQEESASQTEESEAAATSDDAGTYQEEEASAADASSSEKSDETLAVLASEAASSADSASEGEADTVSASCWVVGPDESGSLTTWVPMATFAVASDTTAADLTKQVLDENGITYDDSLYTFTKDGNSVGWDSATGKWWQFFINGESAGVMASYYVLSEGDQIVWYYSAWGDSLPGQVTGTVKVIGKDASGLDQVWLDATSETLVEGSTADELSEAAFASGSLTHNSSTTSWGYYLSTITSPEDGRELGYDASTGAYWHLFVNGEMSQVGASSVTISPGDEVVWYYCTDSDSLPDTDALVVDPTAERPESYESDWAGYKGTDGTGVVRGLATPVSESGTSAKLDWSQSRLTQDMFVNASDAIIVNGDVYDAAQTEVYRRDSQTGEVLDQARLAASVDSTARLQYADGLILVPLRGGRIQALTADTLTTVWVSPELGASTSASGSSVDQQLLSSIAVRDGKAYFSTVAPDGGDSCGGYVACVSMDDGSLVWSYANDSGVGFYWTGAVITDDGVLTADDNGRVYLLDAQSGAVLSTLDLGQRCRAQLSVNGSTAYAVTTDGMLHEILLGEGGTLAAGRSVQFGSYSTSSPTICDGLLYVGGATSDDMTRGSLFVIDLATMSVRYEALVPLTSVDGQAGTGDVKSAPLVSVAADGNTYVYFTCNGKPGGVYCYKLGDAAAATLFTPEESLWQYCMSSVACDGEGNLYFFNDSGTLFKLDAGEKVQTPTNSNEGDGEKGNGAAANEGESAAANGGIASGASASAGSGSKGSNASSGTSGQAGSASTSAVGSSAATSDAASAGEASLLDGFSSEDVSAVSATSNSAQDAGLAATTLGTQGSQSGLPVWPIVGTCIGAALLLILLATRRRKGDQKQEGRRA
ncbi:MAG: DUF4430 domain-containing protein [Tractidigestivibacter sp.]|uniref:DUF4430 domain-containing protein n=1 Tax=Tractidigestivibacter sp. TaxID=2847320 RepID=UPI003D8CD179